MTQIAVSVALCIAILFIEYVLWRRFSACLRGIEFPLLGNSGRVTKKRINLFCTGHALFLCVFVSYLIIAAW